MADFSALKTAIQNYIKQNGNEEITGEILQTILLSIVTTLGDSAIDDLITALNNEVTARQNADSSLEGAINQEGVLRSNADSTLQGNINAEAIARENADAALQAAIDLINSYIPAQTSSSNQLADKAFVNSSIATATATFRGSYNVVTDLELSYNATHAQIQAALATKMTELSITADNNDYAFVQIPTADATPTQIAKTEKYKYNGSAWAFEYVLNNSGFTAAQWAAINSGATLELIGKLSALPTNAELTELLAAKQNVIQDLATIRSGASAGATAVQPATMSAALVATVAESGVYDVTAKNPTAGPNNDGKFTLEYILDQNNVNTLIPTDVRKGGMSIKFVHTSDNKYVQYRYMRTATTGTPNPFLDTANWQGVDDEPTVGSDNLVKSGGVYNNFVDVETKYGDVFISKTYVNTGNHSPILFDGLTIKAGKVLRYKVHTNGTYTRLIINANNNTISIKDSGSSTIENDVAYEYTPAVDIYNLGIWINGDDTVTLSLYYYGIIGNLDDLNTEIKEDDIVKVFNKSNKLFSDATKNVPYNFVDVNLPIPSTSGGNFGNLKGATDLIELHKGMIFYTNASGSGSAAGCVLYDEDKEFVENVEYFMGTAGKSLQYIIDDTILARAKYARFGFYPLNNKPERMFCFVYDIQGSSVLNNVYNLISNHSIKDFSHEYNITPVTESDGSVNGDIITVSKNNGRFYTNNDFSNDYKLNRKVDNTHYTYLVSVLKLKCLSITGAEKVIIQGERSYVLQEFNVGETKEVIAVYNYANQTAINLYGAYYISFNKICSMQIVDAVSFGMSKNLWENIVSNEDYYSFTKSSFFNCPNLIWNHIQFTNPYLLNFADAAAFSNRSLKKALGQYFNRKKMVAYGDSITATAHQPTGTTYVSLVADHYDFLLDNRALDGSIPMASGSTYGEDHNNLRDANIVGVIDTDTMLITISGGQNGWVTSDDIDETDRSTSIGAINYLIDYARSINPLVVIMLVPTYFNTTHLVDPTVPMRDYYRIAENKHVGIAPTIDLKVIDWVNGGTSYRHDGTHPTDYATVRMAAAVISELSKYLY